MNGPKKDNKSPLRIPGKIEKKGINKNPLKIPGKIEKKGKIPPFWNNYRRELIAGAIAVLLAAIIIILTHSGGTVVNNNTTDVNNNTIQIPTKVYSAGGIYIEYPSSWNVTTDEVSGSTIQIVIQDPNSANNPNSTNLTAFTILKAQKDPSQTLEQQKDSFVQGLISSGANIAVVNTTNITINGINATEAIYSGNGPTYQKMELKLVYFEQNNMIYILAGLTKGIDLQSQSPYFDVILNSFRIQ
ncbi:MAG TPA: PsbP-related protein [Methanobacterium sp.]|nr:PsbP-related protein [Methanobacterium sp.]